MWWTRQASGFRGWFSVMEKNGSLRTGLISTDFIVTVIDPADTVTTIPSVIESTKLGLYRFDVPSTFLLTNGAGEYGVVIEVDTVSNPKIVASKSEILRASREDLDSLTVRVYESEPDIR